MISDYILKWKRENVQKDFALEGITESPEMEIIEKEQQHILEDLRKTRIELEIAYSGFDNVTEPDLIDCYIYKVNAVLKRYKFLMEKAASYESMIHPESDIQPQLTRSAGETDYQ